MRRFLVDSRQGVILLVVLGLLALFALVGITFVITAEQARQGSFAAARIEQYDDPPNSLLERALTQVLVGSTNRMSVLQNHSLLEDMYGPHVASAPIPNNGCSPNHYSGTIGQPGYGTFFYITNLTTGSGAFSTVPGYYNGLLLTMTSGPCSGKSARITGYSVQGSQGKLRLFALEGMQMGSGGWVAGTYPLPGDLFIINGRPFNGPGFGYNPATFVSTTASSPNRLLNLTLSGSVSTTPSLTNPYFALAPNPRDASYRSLLDSLPLYADEDYDAPDFQNMLLAFTVNMQTPVFPQSKAGPLVISPSLHRPELINYWAALGAGSGNGAQVLNYLKGDTQLSANGTVRTLKRRVMLRPLVEDHPRFASVNGSFDPTNSMYAPLGFDASGNYTRNWDVDNDGDGVMDSIWVDLGMDVVTDAQGRRYKPLFAIHCIDMDGRLNLNVHGQNNDWPSDTAGFTSAHVAGVSSGTNPSTNTPVRHRHVLDRSPGANGGSLAGATSTTAGLPVGQGLSPAEISLMPVLDEQSFRQLLHGRSLNGSVVIEGRYGEGYLLDIGNNQPGASGTPGPGRSGEDDNQPAEVQASAIFPTDNPMMPTSNRYSAHAYGSPADLDGNGAIAVDAKGQPQYFLQGMKNNSSATAGQGRFPQFGADTGTQFEYVDEAFEFDPAQLRGRSNGSNQAVNIDNPFGPTDLEFMLRTFDRDVQFSTWQAPNTDGRAHWNGDASTDYTTALGNRSPAQSRLRYLLPDTVLNNTYARNLLTTESWDLPVPNIVPTHEIALGLQSVSANIGDVNFIDLIRGRLAYVNGSVNMTTLNDLLSKDLISPDLMLGLRMDISRALGNNYDDNGNGITDEPGEVDSNEPVWANSIPCDRNGDGVIDAYDKLAGPRLAKQLFFLMMLLKDHNYAEAWPGETLTDQQRYELTVRRIAQWAVNVVDYRDQDNIMTPFEYDVNPWNGWNVDGVVGLGSGDDTHTDRRVVWGVEAPALLLTESKAFHDVRVKDTDEEAGGKKTDDATNPDSDPDQMRIPQGSLFVELYCPRNPNNPLYARDLFLSDGRLNLSQMAPAGAGGARYPVWQVAISEAHGVNGQDGTPVDQRVNAAPMTSSIEPKPYSETAAGTPTGPTNPPTTAEPQGWQHFSLTATTGTPVQIERKVWFAAPSDTSDPFPDVMDRQMIYWSRNATNANPIGIAPGQYAVVGPAREGSYGGNITKIGYVATGGTIPQKIEVNTPVRVGEKNSAPSATAPFDAVGTSINPAIGIPCAWLKAHSGSTTNLGLIGLSVSEPRPRLTAGNAFDTARYYDTVSPIVANAPADADGASPMDKYNPAKDDPEDAHLGWPLQEAGLHNQLGTKANYRTIFLQRLANPTAPWDEVANPYITVDFLPLDLTVFNGEDPDYSLMDTGQGGPNFSSRQRGLPRQPANTNAFDIWPPQSALPNAGPTPSGTHNFAYNLNHTLGYINEPFHWVGGTDKWFTSTNTYGNDASLIGYPMKAFPWLNIANRPFISPHELMQVPASSPQRLLYEYSQFNTTEEFYNRTNTNIHRNPFGHLLNFFLSSQADMNPSTSSAPTSVTPANTTNKKGPLSNYHRIFDYLYVPSRFAGTHTLLNPLGFNAANGNQENSTYDNSTYYPFYAPFNRVSTYREPGRINLNTINDQRSNVWLGLTNRYNDRNGDSVEDGNFAATWADIWNSRQGYSAAPMTMDSNYPTYFANPFRGSGAQNVPLLNMQTGPTATATTNPWLQVDSGLLRMDRTGGPYQNEPLLSFRSREANANNQTIGFFNNSDRNSYFRFEQMQKLSNLVTTRSNVYAVWITVGYFEAEPAQTGDLAAYPDGYTIGAELGSDTGEVKRDRGFFLIDRTIPVGFQRGEPNNALKTVILQRILE